MMRGWRIVREKHLATTFSGEGAAEYGGRWNLPGTRMVYTSQSQSLAALELLVHLNPPCPFRYKTIRVEFDESVAQFWNLEKLPGDWAVEPPSLSTQRLGSRWAQEAASLVLAVPSVIVPGEFNYLLNPRHKDFGQIKLGQPEYFTFDRRLLAY
jgi:RES domain-containing protein